MKSLNFSLIRILFAIVVGLVLVLWPDLATIYMVKTIGFAFIIPGIIALVGYFVHKSDSERIRRFPIEGIGSLLFGFWLVINPIFFVNILFILLGLILIIGGIQQIVSLTIARRWMYVPSVFYLVPSLILIAGLIALFNPTGVQNTALMIIGISSLVYAVSELVNWFKFSRRRPKTPKGGGTMIEDAKIIE